MTMNQAVRKSLRAKAKKAYFLAQFGCEKVVITKTEKDGKPATEFEFHYDYGVLSQVRVHENKMIQNVEHNGHRDSLEKFIKQFIKDEQKKFKARKKKQRAKANSLENLCPQLANLNLA